jgi:hypothetical protein
MFTNKGIFFTTASNTQMKDDVSRKDAGLVGKWEIDPDDGKSIQFRIPSASFGGNNDRIGMYFSGSGQIGLGTKDPESAFDVRDNTEDVDAKDRNAKTKIFKVTKKAQKFDVPVTASIVSASSATFSSLKVNNKTVQTTTNLSFSVNKSRQLIITDGTTTWTIS